MTNIVLLAITLKTNHIPGFVSGPEPGLSNVVVQTIAVWHEPRTITTTNYHIGFWQGTNPVEIAVLTPVKLLP